MLRSTETQLRDCLNMLENERRDFFKVRKAYEEKLQQVEGHRADLERRIDQMTYDLDVRDSELNRISNVGKTVADELQFGKVIVFEERFKSLSKEKSDPSKQVGREMSRLRDENAFLKKVTARRQPCETLLEQQKRKLIEYEREMADALK
ncbi:unnamed protein product [Sphagnum jensenii]